MADANIGAAFIKRSAVTDISSTITTGGTAQVLTAANGYRRGFWVQNLSAGDLYINETGTATTSGSSLRIPAGALYESPRDQSTVEAISIIGATTAQAFSGRQW